MNILSPEKQAVVWFPEVVFDNMAQEDDWMEMLLSRRYFIVRNPQNTFEPSVKTDMVNAFMYAGTYTGTGRVERFGGPVGVKWWGSPVRPVYVCCAILLAFLAYFLVLDLPFFLCLVYGRDALLCRLFMWYHKPEAPANGGQSHSVHAWTFGAFFAFGPGRFFGPVPMSEWSMGFECVSFSFCCLFKRNVEGVLEPLANEQLISCVA